MNAEAWRQAKSVLAEALVCPPGERDALVMARCPDPSLRREVQSYLNQYDEDFLESVLTVSGTFDSTSPAAAEDAAEMPDIRAGDHIGPYVVIDRVGAGGMGQVFLGNDTRLHRKVALKCLTASASRVDVRSRILHEARAAARITHPNIAVVHDVIEHEGRPFLVMEYVEGESLAAVLRRERLPLERILAIGRQLASALGAAHAKGIIHRDLKPANIQVMPGGSVKVLDFGVAQAMLVATGNSDATTTVTAPPSLSTTATLRTERGILHHPGTPAYMSPEQMFGKPIDQRSDIYSLGIILYEMCAGHRPYSTDDPLEVVVALSRSPVAAGGRDLPASVGDVIGKMLAVDLDHRYQTAVEVEAALSAVAAPPLSETAVRTSTRARTRLFKAAAVIATIPLALSALGFLELTAFDYALGRVPPFDTEPRLAWLGAGASAVFLPLLYQITFFFVIAAGRFTVRMLTLWRGIDRLLSTGLTRTKGLTSRLGLDDPVVMAQAVALIGVLTLAALIVGFRDVIRAWMARIDTYPLDALAPLRPGNRTAYQTYHFLLSVLIFMLTLAVVRIARLRSSQGGRRGAGSFALVVGLLAFSIVMLVLPHRLSQTPIFERIDVARDKCFVLGEHDDRLQVYCPADPPPRNRIISRGAPGVVRLGTRQNIFAPVEESR